MPTATISPRWLERDRNEDKKLVQLKRQKGGRTRLSQILWEKAPFLRACRRHSWTQARKGFISRPMSMAFRPSSVTTRGSSKKARSTMEVGVLASWCTGEVRVSVPNTLGLFCFDMVYLFCFFLHWVDVKALKSTDTTQAFDSAEWNPRGVELLLRVKPLVSEKQGVRV